ncbi:MAG: hypothetical protein LBP87_13795 [Planctomycetaceae bacterium]|jgi:hypothetical protein|nr:hypothetical protein [Planctomycetaceae bacterium]
MLKGEFYFLYSKIEFQIITVLIKNPVTSIYPAKKNVDTIILSEGVYQCKNLIVGLEMQIVRLAKRETPNSQFYSP